MSLGSRGLTLCVIRHRRAASAVLSPNAVMIGGGRSSTSCARPTLQDVDGAPTRTTAMSGMGLASDDLVISRRILSRFRCLCVRPQLCIYPDGAKGAVGSPVKTAGLRCLVQPLSFR
jgi:hypothetical protein